MNDVFSRPVGPTTAPSISMTPRKCRLTARITSSKSGSLDQDNGIDTGVFLMSGRLFDCLGRVYAAGDASLTGGNRLLASERLLFAEPIGELEWQDIDTANDLAAAERIARRLRLSKTDDHQ